MTLSFDNLPPVIADLTQHVVQRTAPNEAEIYCWMNDGIEVSVRMKRIFQDHGVPENAQHSAFKMVKDTATVTIEPPNEELANIISKYFLSEVIPALMGAPERQLFDEVTINDKRII